MTGIDSQLVDKPEWSRKEIAATVRKICKDCGTLYFCPCQTQGSPESTYEGVYEAIDEEIVKMSCEMFK